MAGAGLDLKELARRVLTLRTARDLSQRQLAAEAGVSHNWVAMVEKGRIPNPGGQKLDQLARALGLGGWLELAGPRAPDSVGAPRNVPAAAASDADGINPGELVYPARTGVTASDTGGERAALEAALREIQARIVELTRATQVRLAPVYQWGSCGDPLEGEVTPVGQRPVPVGMEGRVGQRGFAVQVAGESMARRRIYDGDFVWVNPDRGWRVGSIVLARVDGYGMVVKEVALDGSGRTTLRGAGANGENGKVNGREHVVIGPVVVVEPAAFATDEQPAL